MTAHSICNRKLHPMVAENVGHQSNGKRYCIACRLANPRPLKGLRRRNEPRIVCWRGLHPMSGDNLELGALRPGTNKPARICRACRETYSRAAKRQHYQRYRAKHPERFTNGVIVRKHFHLGDASPTGNELRVLNCPECQRAGGDQVTNKSRSHYFKRTYGITIEDYDSLAQSQSWLCAICHRPESRPGKRLGVDHDHATGLIRGLLCNNCNRGIGNFSDDPERLANAAEYLSRRLLRVVS